MRCRRLCQSGVCASFGWVCLSLLLLHLACCLAHMRGCDAHRLIQTNCIPTLVTHHITSHHVTSHAGSDQPSKNEIPPEVQVHTHTPGGRGGGRKKGQKKPSNKPFSGICPNPPQNTQQPPLSFITRPRPSYHPPKPITIQHKNQHKKIHNTFHQAKAKFVCDLVRQCARLGELRTGIQSGLLKASSK